MALSPGIALQGWPLGFVLMPPARTPDTAVLLSSAQPGLGVLGDLFFFSKTIEGARLYPRVPPFPCPSDEGLC